MQSPTLSRRELLVASGAMAATLALLSNRFAYAAPLKQGDEVLPWLDQPVDAHGNRSQGIGHRGNSGPNLDADILQCCHPSRIGCVEMEDHNLNGGSGILGGHGGVDMGVNSDGANGWRRHGQEEIEVKGLVRQRLDLRNAHADRGGGSSATPSTPSPPALLTAATSSGRATKPIPAPTNG